MIYLIGGAPRCGKTTVARNLGQACCCSYVPADYLGTAFTNYIAEVELPARYPAWNVATVDERFATYATTEIITNYRTKAETVWPGLRDFIVYALYQQHDMIIEGYQFEPRFVHELCVTYSQFPITAVFLCREQIDAIRDDLKKSTDPEDWVLQSTTQEVTWTRIATMVRQYSVFFREEATKYNLVTFNMDQSFPERVTEVTAYLRSISSQQ